MKDIADLVDQYPCRVQEMRVIADGIGDQAERNAFLEFVGEYERLAREVKSKDLRVTLPTALS